MHTHAHKRTPTNTSRTRHALTHPHTPKKPTASLYFLGLLRLYGQGGLPVDPVKAYANIQEAANLDHHEAQTALGLMLLHGHGVDRNPKSARSWFRRAARAGSKESQWLLGKLLYGGDMGTAAGIEATDDELDEAVGWFRKAADQGSPQAAYYLGLVHEYHPRDQPLNQR